MPPRRIRSQCVTRPIMGAFPLSVFNGLSCRGWLRGQCQRGAMALQHPRRPGSAPFCRYSHLWIPRLHEALKTRRCFLGGVATVSRTPRRCRGAWRRRAPCRRCDARSGHGPSPASVPLSGTSGGPLRPDRASANQPRRVGVAIATTNVLGRQRRPRSSRTRSSRWTATEPQDVYS